MDSLIGKITEAVSSAFGNIVWLATIIISMFPLIELKGGISFALTRGLSIFDSLLFGMIGSFIIVPILALVFIPIINALKRTKLFKKLALSIENKVKKKSDEISQSVDNKNLVLEEENIKKKQRRKYWIKFFSIVAFVAVPIPLTGFWTGTCIAVAIGLNFWGTCASVLIGNIVAGLLVSALCALFGEHIVFLVMISIVVLIILYIITKLIINKIKSNKDKKSKA